MGFTGAHVLRTFDAFILALYLLSHGCALLKYKNPSLFDALRLDATRFTFPRCERV